MRSQYYSDPSTKHLEVYSDFSGGLNTVSTNDSLANSETTILINKDLGDRGSVRRRSGMVRQLTVPVEGKGQGYFRYYKKNGEVEEIVAVNGKLYKAGAELAITGLASFQTERQIEAVQFGDKLYIATGTKLVQYDGTVAKIVEPYKPQPLEALYIGTNGLADDPDNFIQDGEATFLRIDGVTVTRRYGVINKPTTFEVFISKPAGKTVEYEFNYRKKGATDWIEAKAFSSAKTWEFTPTETAEFEFDIYARETGVTDITKYARYVLPSYKVESTEKEPQVDTSTMQKSNRIILHWSRLIMYGDPDQPQAIYVSEVNRPDYFPVSNSLEFVNERREPLTALVQFRDSIVAFTPTTVQALYGKYPAEFQRVMLNTNLGCIAPYSAKVMGNYVAFLSREGIHILKNLGYTESRLNVEKIDSRIDNLIPRHTDACAYTLNGQYHILFPQQKKRFRMYYDLPRMPWTSDESDKLDFNRFYEFDGVLYGQSSNLGHVQRFSSEVWDDDGHVYQDIVETKYFDFGQPYSPKKLKEIQLLLANHVTNSNLILYVYADASDVLNPDTSYASVENGVVKWNTITTPNVELIAGTTFGAWTLGESPFGNVKSHVKKLRISGKCLRTKAILINEEPFPNQLLGLAYVFKTKKP